MDEPLIYPDTTLGLPLGPDLDELLLTPRQFKRKWRCGLYEDMTPGRQARLEQLRADIRAFLAEQDPTLLMQEELR